MTEQDITQIQDAQYKAAAVIGMLAQYVDTADTDAAEYKDTVAGAVMELRDLIYAQRDRIQSLVG